MRLFTGLSLPPDVSASIAQLCQELRALSPPKLAWTPVEKLHITTKFIGEFPENRLAQLHATLTSIAAKFAPLDVRIRGLDWMPAPGHPIALYAVVDPTEPLLGLAAETGNVLESLGITKEKRPYRPHVTLARVRQPDLAAFRVFQSALAKRNSPEIVKDLGIFRATSFFLYLSSSSKYTKLKEFTFS